MSRFSNIRLVDFIVEYQIKRLCDLLSLKKNIILFGCSGDAFM